MFESIGLDVMARHHRRGMAKVTITKLAECVVELEHKLQLTHSGQLAAQLSQQRLTGLDGGFKCYNLSIVNLLKNVEELETEQAATDNHYDRVTDLSMTLCALLH